MKKFLFMGLFIGLTAALLMPQTLKDEAAGLSRVEMQSIVEFLGHDLLEGRAPGSRGGYLAEIYLRSLFKFMNLEPASGSDYMQPFALHGYTVDDMRMLTPGVIFSYPRDIVGAFIGAGDFHMEAEAVFVGFGISTPIWKWDDFKDADVSGKLIIARVNDPGMYIPEIFEGKTLTYFGRWTYHIEEAARRGAAGILLIHTDESAGYNWNVVQNSWAGEEVYLPSDLNNNLKFRAWIKESCFRQLLARYKMDLDLLYKKSLSRSFKPVPLGFSVTLEGKSRFRAIMNHNVVAKIPGRSSKEIVLSAHIDHLGKVSEGSEEKIFNGAIDNGSAVAAMLLCAKALSRCREELEYTIVFLACNAEESGLLGSKHFVRTHPGRDNIIANINFESTPVWGATTDFMAVGARFSTLEDMLKELCVQQGLQYTEFSLVNQGFFYRSDQFSFARHGIPAIWISAGENDDSGQTKYPVFWKTNYHTPQDDYDPSWTLEGMRQTVGMTLLLLDRINKSKQAPEWKNGVTFPFEPGCGPGGSRGKSPAKNGR